MPDKCDDCGREYFVIYNVPSSLWKKIAPKPETLLGSQDYYYGGILCPDCAARKARDIGVTLHFIATEWRDDEAAYSTIIKEGDE